MYFTLLNYQANENKQKINEVLQLPGKFFKIKFFFSLPGEVFLIKKKKSFYEKFAGRQQ
jgi:hypothetical protein